MQNAKKLPVERMEGVKEINVKNQMMHLQTDKAPHFCASGMWMHRFCKRKIIKHRKKKSGRQKTAKEKLDVIKKVSVINFSLHS